MRVASTMTDQKRHFRQTFAAVRPPQDEIKRDENFSALTKDAAEITIIALLCAVLFFGLSFWTLKFLELIILLFRQTFFPPPIFETRETIFWFFGFS
jgi:hypothetical protein